MKSLIEIHEDLRRERGPIVDEFAAIMTIEIGLKWGMGHGAGGTGNVTRAIVKHTECPTVFVDRLAEAELLHPDVIELIREHLEILKGDPDQLARF